MKQAALITLLCLLSGLATADFELKDPAAVNEAEANQKITFGEQDVYAVEGAGVKTCKQYQADRQSNDAMHFINLNWAKGFVTGVNYVRMEEHKSSKLGAGLDLDALTLYIDNFCVQNPRATLSDASAALVNELIY